MMALSRKESVFLELLQIGMWGTHPNLERLTGLTPEDWEEVIQFSIEQGVQAIVFSAALHLPENLHPPRHLKLKWIVNVDAIEKRFDRYLNTCADLVKLYAKNGIKNIMVLKGIGLAYQYPIPQHRECGDIDIYLFGDYEHGNRAIKREGIKLDHADKKHLMFYYQGIPIENHRKFLNEHRYKVDVLLETVLNETLKTVECDIVALPQNVSVLSPPPTFNAIFLARHMIVHFPSGMSVRHLCDWAIFLEKNQGKYDTKYVIRELQNTGQLELITIFSSICVKYLGLSKSCNPFEEVEDSELEERIVADVLRGDSELTDSSNPFKIMMSKWNRFYNSLWKQQLSNRMSKPHLIWESVVEHIINPSSIFRT